MRLVSNEPKVLEGLVRAKVRGRWCAKKRASRQREGAGEQGRLVSALTCSLLSGLSILPRPDALREKRGYVIEVAF